MPDVIQAQQQVQRAEQQIAEAREQAAQQRRETEAAKQAIIAAQQKLSTAQVQRQQLSSIQGLSQRNLLLQQLSTSKESVAAREEVLGSYEADIGAYEKQVADVKSQIAKVQQSQAEAAKMKADYEKALRVAESGNAGDIFSLENAQQKKFYKQIQMGKADAIRATVKDLESQGVPPERLAEVTKELYTNIGKIDSVKLTERINKIINPPTVTTATVGAAELTPKQSQVLSTDKPIIVNGLGVQSGVSTGANLLLPSGQPSVDSNLPWYRRIFKGVEAAKEVYNPALGPVSAETGRPIGAFQSVNVPGSITGSGTPFQRPPTLEESKIIISAQQRGDLFSIPVQQIIQKNIKFRELTKGFESLTPEQQEIRVAELKNIGATVNALTNEIQAPTVGFGLPSYFGIPKTQVPITEFSGRSTAPVYISALGYIVEKGSANIARNIGIPNVKLAEYQAQVPNLPYRTRGTIMGGDILKGDISTTQTMEVTVPQQTIISPEGIGAVTRAATVEFNPYLFGTRIISDVGTTLGQSERLRDFPGNFIRSNPVEAAGIFTLGTAYGLVKSAQIIRRGSRLFSPEIKILRTTETLPSKNPLIFLEPQKTEGMILPGGARVEQTGFNIFGRARGGATVSKTEVFAQSPIQEFFGLKTPIYSSAEGGFSRTFDLITGRELTRVSNYQKALKTLQERGLTLSQAQRELRQYAKSPTDITILGQAQVLTGTGIKPRINVQTETLYNPRQVTTSIGVRTTSFQPYKEKTGQIGYLLGQIRDKNVYGSFPESVKVFYQPGKPSQEFSKLSQIGRTTERLKEYSTAQELGTIELNIPSTTPGVATPKKFKIFKDKSVSKSIAPAKSQLRFGKSTVLVAERPNVPTIDFGQPVSVTEIPKTTAPKTDVVITDEQAQSLVQSLKKIYGQDNSVLKEVIAKLPKPVVPSGAKNVPSSGTVTLKSTSSAVPSVSISLPRSTGAFAGLGTYEVTGGNVAAIPIPGIRASVITTPTTNITQASINVTKPTTVSASALSLESGTRPNINTTFLGALKDLTRTEQGQNFVQKLFSQYRNAQQTKQTFSQTTKTTTTTEKVNQKQNIKPPKPIKIKIPKSSAVKTNKLFEDTESLVNVYIRRRGKDIKIGSKSTLSEAKDILVGKLKGTLAASGFLETKGQRVKLSRYAPASIEFGAAKRDSNRLVQRRGFRLGTGSERAEIKASKRSILR